MNRKFFEVIFQEELYTGLPKQTDVFIKRASKQSELLPVTESEAKNVLFILDKSLRGKISGRYRRNVVFIAQNKAENRYYVLTPALFWFSPMTGRGNLTDGQVFTEIEMMTYRFNFIMVGTGEIQQYMRLDFEE